MFKQFDCAIVDDSFGNICNKKQIGKWSEMSILNINVLKLVFTNEFVRILSIITDVFLVTLGDVFNVGVKLF